VGVSTRVVKKKRAVHNIDLKGKNKHGECATREEVDTKHGRQLERIKQTKP